MTHAYLDANILLRYLTDDNPSQKKRVRDVFTQAQKGTNALHLPWYIVAEVVYVLLHWYELPKADIVKNLTVILEQNWIEVEDRYLLIEGLDMFQKLSVDFADVLLWAKAKKNGWKIYSFDKHFDKLPGNLRLEP